MADNLYSRLASRHPERPSHAAFLLPGAARDPLTRGWRVADVNMAAKRPTAS